jgi:hypothetical protein
MRPSRFVDALASPYYDWKPVMSVPRTSERRWMLRGCQAHSRRPSLHEGAEVTLVRELGIVSAAVPT